MSEQDLVDPAHDYLCAFDEVGRGPLAGPVHACGVGVTLKDSGLLTFLMTLKELGVADSKKLTGQKRSRLIEYLNIDLQALVHDVVEIQVAGVLVKIAIGEVSPQDIDKINIHHASLLAMERAKERLALATKNSLNLVDGKFVPDVWKDEDSRSIVKGDSKYVTIGLASIIAKEFRDTYMSEAAVSFPQYGFERHAGYPSQFHKQMISKWGISPLHRKSYRGVKEYL